MGAGYAQTQIPTTQGKEFWVSFMRNGYRSNGTPDHLYMIASSKHACTVTVTNPSTGYVNTFFVPEQDAQTVAIPDIAGYNSQQSGNANKGLYVSATDTISLYIANETENSYDAANVLPIQALGCNYMVQTNKSLYYQSPTFNHSDDIKASFLIIATEDDTQVQITPACQTMDNHSDTYTVTLQRGECYHVLNKNPGYSNNSEGDFSGTRIESFDNKPIAVFNGNSVTSVDDESVSSGYDHVFEQAMPVDNWGTHFVLTKTNTPENASVQNDRVKITALYDNTVVRRGNGTELCRLNAGASYAFWLTETSLYLESNSPVAIYLYNHSHSSGNTYGDPSMVWISPVEQNLREVIFSTFTSTANLNHFVNVVCYTEDATELYLNGVRIPQSQIHTVTDAPQFSFARVPVDPGMNRLSCPGGLVAHVYGMGDRQGYAYTVGSSARILTNQLLVNGDPVVDEYVTCQFEMLDFKMETNYEPDLVKWNFGDESPEEYGAEVFHAFDKTGHFYVEAVVDHVVNGEPQSDTLDATIHVNSVKEYDEEPWSTCGTTYLYHGVEYAVPGDYDVTLESADGCDSIVHIHLTQGDEVVFNLDPVVACESYEWFGVSYTATDHHLEHRVSNATPEGCDSLYILDLTIGYPPVNPEREKNSCAPYIWDDRIVCDTTGVYHLSFETAEHCVYDSTLRFTRIATESRDIIKDTCDQYEWMGKMYSDIGYHTYDTIVEDVYGCTSHYTLRLTLHQSPPFEEIKGLSNVAVATSFWPGQYFYCLDDSTGMDANNIHWELMGNPEGPGQWELIPHGASCTVVVHSLGERILWVGAGDGQCYKETYKIIGGFGYDVEETEWANLEVYPNPASDELVVKGPEMLELTIYNLLGQQMKSVTAGGETEVRLGVAELPQALYLLAIRTRRGNKTLLVSVIN